LRVIGHIIPLARRLRIKIPAPKDRPKTWSDLEGLVQQMAPAIVLAAQELVQQGSLQDELPSIGQEAERIVKGSLELLRQRGMYTDLDDTGVRCRLM